MFSIGARSSDDDGQSSTLTLLFPIMCSFLVALGTLALSCLYIPP